MKVGKKLVAVALSLLLVLSALPVGVIVFGEDYKPAEKPSDYFYHQLNERAKAIYTKLLDEWTNKSQQDIDGTGVIDLMNLKGGENGETTVIGTQDVQAYVESGNKDIFNDFCAAKDALDLDHSELWYIDSGYLTFQVTQEGEEYHVLIGPGRGETYLLAGQKIDDLKTKIDATDKAVEEITKEALRTLKQAEQQAGAEYSEQDRIAALVTSVHDQVTKKIHYRYETECRTVDGVDHANAKYIRTLYGIVTHEGVCEAYARTLQVCLTKLGVESVLVHGVQTKGTPEDHMWNAVNIPEGDEDHWYVVDATFDDPLTANWDGTRDLTFKDGLDEKETNTYLMVGQSLVGEYWRPSGFVSTGNFEFAYPTIEINAYAGATVVDDANGLKVKYSAGGSQEDGVPAGVYTATFNGMNAEQAQEKGFYFMTKLYDYHPDGTADVMDDWYYAAATLLVAGGNPYFGDYPDGLRFSSPSCEYIEIAVTTRAPDHIEEWSTNPETSYLSQNYEAGFFHGTDDEIVASSGMLYNLNSSYEAPPYVVKQNPPPTGNCTAGVTYRFQVLYDDDLYHILPRYAEGENGIATVADVHFVNDYETAKNQTVQVRYGTRQQDLHTGGEMNTVVVGELPFDANRDGVVDMEGDVTDFRWIYKSDPEDQGGQGVACPNSAYHADGDKPCSVEDGCPVVGVEFNFRASDQWIDDITEYTFSIEGLVGSRSSKYANKFTVISAVDGMCPTCLRGQGIDWNVWGQPTLLDAPENLDLYGMAQSGGTDQETLDALQEEMHVSDIDGRLMLVVEDKSKGVGNRDEYGKIDGYLEENGDVEGEVVSSSVFEINFNRICPAVKLEPNQGQSIRVQVGYPAGVTYESLGSGQIELKAYHFTRCSENKPCEEYEKESPSEKLAHKWGSHIISVEEIEIIPTPYGMIIMCSAFSPFEIVAVEGSGTAPAATGEKTLIVVSDGNGKVTYTDNGVEKEAVGADGNVHFADGEQKTFTLAPEEGYTVNTVSLDGEEITVEEDGTFTVDAPENSGAVLSVTYVPETVKTETTSSYGEPVVAKVCTHTNVVTVEDPAHPEKEPTCTEDGYKAGTKCQDCGQTLTAGQVIPATGHTVDETSYEAAKNPTCTEEGHREKAECATCGATLAAGETVPASGHTFTKYDNEGDPTCEGQLKKATCDRCGEVTETQLDPDGAVDHVFDHVKETTKNPCTGEEITVYQCKWCDETKPDIKPGTENNHQWSLKESKPATCSHHTENTYECSVCHLTYTEVLEDDLLPHEIVSPDPEKSTPATCTETGIAVGLCSVCHEEVSQEIPAFGHNWDVENPAWTWSTDGEVTAQVTITCKNDPEGHPHTEKASVMSEVKDATCTEAGLATYTATASFDGKTFTDTKEVKIPATGHTLTKVEAREPTVLDDGNIEYYKCESCGKLFKDAEGKEEIQLQDTVLPQLEDTAQHIPGDLNGNGGLDIHDALDMFIYANGSMAVPEGHLDKLDINGDSLFNLMDVYIVYQVVSGT